VPELQGEAIRADVGLAAIRDEPQFTISADGIADDALVVIAQGV
jgi:hypothetical protein